MRMRPRRLRRQKISTHSLLVPAHLLDDVARVRLYTRKNKKSGPGVDLDRFNGGYFVRNNANCLGFLLNIQADVQPAFELDYCTPDARSLDDRQNDPLEDRLRREGGFHPLPSGALVRPTESAILVVVMKEAQGDDFHVMLYSAGRWYHKPGTNLASDRDARGRVVKDPSTAAYYSSYELVGFFWLERAESTSYLIMRKQNRIDFVVDTSVW